MPFSCTDFSRYLIAFSLHLDSYLFSDHSILFMTNINPLSQIYVLPFDLSIIKSLSSQQLNLTIFDQHCKFTFKRRIQWPL